MALRIAFIGYNEAQTYTYFTDLAVVNADQVRRFDRRHGLIFLKDGTVIERVSSSPEFLKGRRFDQVFLADDRRLGILEARSKEIAELCRCLVGSCVPVEFSFLFYDLDAEV